MPPELTAVKVQINFSLIYYYDPYFCNRVQVQTNNTIYPPKNSNIDKTTRFGATTGNYTLISK